MDSTVDPHVLRCLESRDASLVVVGGDFAEPPAGTVWLVENLLEATPAISLIDRVLCNCYSTLDFFARITHTVPRSSEVSRLLIYDRYGISLDIQIPTFSDVHSPSWSGSNIVVPNTGKNEVVEIDLTGKISSVWTPTGSGIDLWHINGAETHAGSTYVTAFGRFDEVHGWNTEGAEGKGFLLNVSSGEIVVDGLSCPHDPRYVDGRWLVCDSFKGNLCIISPGGADRKTVQMSYWTRGVAILRERIYVGLSANRKTAQDGGYISVVDRENFEVLANFKMPCREIHSITAVPRYLGSVLRRNPASK